MTHNYAAAIDIYQFGLDADTADDLGLKPLLMDHVEMLISSSSQDHFTELTELYLSVFYDDIDVLLSLTKFNRSTGFLAEAAAVLHLVKSYAYTNLDKIRVEAAIDHFIGQVHADLVSADDLFGLANIYQQMYRLNLLRPIHRLSQAQLSIQIDNMTVAREILNDLIKEPSVSATAERIMFCLLYTSDASAARPCVDLGCFRIIINIIITKNIIYTTTASKLPHNQLHNTNHSP